MGPVIGLKLTHLYPQKKDVDLRFLVTQIKVGIDTPSKTFITSPQIREAISASTLKQGSNFGGCVMEYNPATQKLRFTSFFPLPEYRGVPEKQFAGMGIASIIEARMLREAKKAFPDAKTITHFKPSPMRLKQLRKRGFFGWRVKMGIGKDSFEKALREKLAKDISKKRRR